MRSGSWMAGGGNVAGCCSYSPRPLWNNALSSNIVLLGLEPLRANNGEQEILSKRERARESRTSASSCIASTLSSASARSNGIDAAVFRSNWIYREFPEYRETANMRIHRLSGTSCRTIFHPLSLSIYTHHPSIFLLNYPQLRQGISAPRLQSAT